MMRLTSCLIMAAALQVPAAVVAQQITTAGWVDRVLVERLDGTVRWHPADKTVWAAFPAQARTIRMTVGSPVAQVFEYAPSDPHRTGRLIQTQRLDQPPILVNGHVFAPVAAAARVAGATVWFEPGTRQVMVQTGPPDQTASG